MRDAIFFRVEVGHNKTKLEDVKGDGNIGEITWLGGVANANSWSIYWSSVTNQ